MVLYSNTLHSVTELDKNYNKTYYQAGHFIGKTEVIKDLTNNILSMINIDTKNRIHTKWHDETYFNFFFNFRNEKYSVNVVSGLQYLSGINQGKIRAINKDILFKNIRDLKDVIKTICDKIKTKKQDCILIGANPSLKSKNLGYIIDNSNAFIVRLNREPSKELNEYQGMKTDLYIGCQGTLRNVNNKIIIDDNLLKEISLNFIPVKEKWLHTGFIAILILIELFKTIKIYGFGYTGVTEDDNNVKFTHEYDMTNRINHHLLNYEHSLIDEMVKNGKITRLEEI